MLTINKTTATMGKEIKGPSEVGEDNVGRALKFQVENTIVSAEFLQELVPGIRSALWTKKGEPKLLQLFPLKVKGRLEGTLTIDQQVFNGCKIRRFRATPVNDHKASVTLEVYMHPADNDYDFLSKLCRQGVKFSMRAEMDNTADQQPDMIDRANGADDESEEGEE